MVEYVREGEGFVAYERAPNGREAIRAYEDLERLGESWNGKTLVGLYNTLASTQGTTTVKKFTNHDTGMKRLWGLPLAIPPATTTIGVWPTTVPANWRISTLAAPVLERETLRR